MNDEQRELLADIERSAALMLGLVNDLLDFSKIEAGKLELERRPADLAELLRHSLKINAMLARLHESFRRLSEFSSDIAHELRTPIHNLLIQTQVTLGGEENLPAYRAVLQSNEEECQRLSKMISDMLFLAKADNKLVSLKNALRLSLADAPELRTELKATVRRFDALLDAIERQLALLLQEQFPQQLKRLLGIIGVGPLVGAGLAQALSRLPFANAQAFIAFTGLDPRPQDSGHHKGRRRLSKRGPPELRRLLFNAAMSAAKTKAWKPLYEHYRNRGLSATASLVILARKIARIAYALWHGQAEFDPKRLELA